MSQNEKPRIRVKAGTDRHQEKMDRHAANYSFGARKGLGYFVDTYKTQYEELKVCRKALAEAEAEIEALRLTELPKGWVALSPSAHNDLVSAKRGRDELKAHVKDLAEQLAGRIAECDRLHECLSEIEDIAAGK